LQEIDSCGILKGMPLRVYPKRKQMVSTRRLLGFGFGAFAIVLLGVSLYPENKPVAVEAQCDTVSVAQQYAAADLVLTGEVFLVVPDGVENAKVLITPSRLYKGKVPAIGIAIAAKAGANKVESDVAGELHFASGQPPYLLFLKTGENGVYTTSRCMGSRLLGEGLTSEERKAFGI
jgi:hypothetical protein